MEGVFDELDAWVDDHCGAVGPEPLVLVELGSLWGRTLQMVLERGDSDDTARLVSLVEDRLDDQLYRLVAMLRSAGVRSQPSLTKRLLASAALCGALLAERSGAGWGDLVGVAAGRWCDKEIALPTPQASWAAAHPVLGALGTLAQGDTGLVSLYLLARHLLGVGLPVTSTVNLGIPVVEGGMGAVAEVSMTAVEGLGVSGLFPSMPEDLFYPVLDDDFQEALDAAGVLAQRSGMSVVVQFHPAEVRPAVSTVVTHGSSAGLALGTGISLLADGRVPDDKVALTGVLTMDGELARLDDPTGLPIKAAACAHGHWRLLVHENDLAHLDGHTGGAVTPVTTLDAAADVAALPASALSAWADGQLQSLAHPPIYLQMGGRVSAEAWAHLHQEVRVSDRSKDSAPAPGGSEPPGEPESPGEPMTAPPAPSPWENERRTGRFGFQVTGDPGLGKSTLTDTEAQRAHRLLCDQLNDAVPASELALAVRIRAEAITTSLDALGEDDRRNPDRLLGALHEAMVGSLSHHPIVAAFLTRRLESTAEHVVCLVDGMDEVTGTEGARSKRTRQEDVARALGQLIATGASILLTGRPGTPTVAGLRQVELAPFTPTQVRAYARARLGPERGAALLARLTGPLATASRIPLLCSFCCEIADRPEAFPETVSGLYEAVVRDLLREGWKSTQRDEDEVTRLLDGLSALAWVLHQESTSMPVDSTTIRRFTRSTDVEVDYDTVTGTAVLVQDGDHFSFLHPTIGEYLAARHLATRPDDALSILHAHHFDPASRSFIVFVAGCLEDPGPFLDALVAAYRDHPAHLYLLSLAASCLGARPHDEEATTTIADEIVGVCRTALASGCGPLQNTAASVLGGIGDLRAVEALIALLGDEEPDVRWAAASALGEIGGPRAIEALLGDEDPSVRRAAAEALGGIVDLRAVEALIALLGDEDPSVRRAAAEALGGIGDLRAVEALIALLGDEEPDVRWAAAWALGKIGGPRAVEALVALLGDEELDVRREAATALGGVGGTLAVEALVARLGDEAPSVRWEAAEVLGWIGDPRSVEALIPRLDDEDPSVGRVAAEALGGIGGPRAVEALIALLGDEDPFVRWAVAGVLARKGDPHAVEALVPRLGDENPFVRRAAAWALGRIGRTLAVEAVTACLDDEEDIVRLGAVWALDGIAGIRAIEALVALLGDEELDVRREAATALGRIGDSRAIEALVLHLGDVDRSVRREAATALGRIGDSRAIEALVLHLGEDPFVRWAVAEALGKIGDRRAVEALVALLGDQDPFVRRNAASALGRIGGHRAVEALVALLDDEDLSVRRNAASALGGIGDPRAIEALAEHFADTGLGPCDLLGMVTADQLAAAVAAGTVEDRVLAAFDRATAQLLQR